MERRLSAILAADVVGYSRLVERDEAGTLAALKAHRRELIDPAVAEHHGRTVKVMGDGALVEFASVVDAVVCATAIQKGMANRNQGVPEDRRIELRIGVHLGDIVVENDDIYGDGVNVAARLEGLAEPGGICISQQAYDHVETKLDLPVEDLGPQQVKNIARPVRVYRLQRGGAAPHVPPDSRRRRSFRPQFAAAAAAIGLAAAALLVGWWQPWTPEMDPASTDDMALPLPDKPSIAVLPFDNLSDDPSQDYFADGMTEDLITDLSKISGLFVIARNSSFAYKGRQVKVSQIAEDLGVRYVLEGSVRRAGDQVRINAQLIDAISGGHVWAERYDRKLDNIFAVQDAITGKVVQALEVHLTSADKQRDDGRPRTTSLEAYDLVLRARDLMTRFDREAANEARKLLEQAVELDPAYTEAHSLLGLYYFDEWRLWGRNRDQSLSRALELAKTAVELDPSDPAPRVLLAQVHQFRREFEAAIEEADRALALEPSEAVTLANLGSMLRYAHRPGDAVEVIERAIRLDPFHPPNYLEWLGKAYFFLGRYRDCIEATDRGVALNPDFVALHVVRTQCYAAMGEQEKAEESAADILRTNPRFTLSAYESYVPFSEKEDLRRSVETLRKAGLPE